MSIAPDRLVTRPVEDDGICADAREAVSGTPWLKRIGKWLAAGIMLILVVDLATSILIRRPSVRKRLDARLSASFGRPVQADGYSFSLWGGPTLEATGVTVGEDPRFGYEYFLRTDRLEARLRLGRLLRGRLEPGTLSLTGPTLNVEENAAHELNVAEWLGRPVATEEGMGPRQATLSAPRFYKIQLDGGRINFKRGSDKLPFAFVDVGGSIESDGAGRWRVDLKTSPWRVATVLQQTGTIHLTGTIGGTSSALRPADLQINWRDASISDFLRLIRGDDSGVRGSLAMRLNAHTETDGWQIDGGAQIGALHRWDLAARFDNPSLNVEGNLELDLAASRLTIVHATVSAPHSNAQLQGEFSWSSLVSKERSPKSNESSSPPDLQITSASIDANDGLSWLRAFHSGIPDDFMVRGNAKAQASLSTWPPRRIAVSASSYGMEISGGPIRQPIHVGQTHVNYDQGILSLAPTSVIIGGGPVPAAGSFIVQVPASVQKRNHVATQAGLHIAGSSPDADSLMAAANALGWHALNGWSVQGPLRCDLTWAPNRWPWQASPDGTVFLGSAGGQAGSLRAPFLNLPMTGLQVRVASRGGARHIVVNSAELFGSRWNGTFERSNSDPEWQFALFGGRLDATDLDRWLDPKWRETLIDRMLPFLNSGSASTGGTAGLHATGHLSLDAFVLTPFTIDGMQGSLKIDGPHINFSSATGNISGGKVSGDLDATLGSRPAYFAHVTISEVELTALSQNTGLASAPYAGVASGDVSFWMQGTSREDLLSSLRCSGALDVRNAAWNGLSLGESIEAVARVAGNSSYSDASGRFACGNRVLTFTDVVLVDETNKIAVSGTVDYSKSVNLQLRFVPAAPVGGHVIVPASARSTAASVLMTGTLDAPEFRQVLPPVRRAR